MGLHRRCNMMGAITSGLAGQDWDVESVPDLTGKVALVTGANTGIGYEVAKELATHGARVLLCGRKPEKVAEAVKRLKGCRPTCTVEGYVVDLASFSSIDAFVKELKDKAKLKALHCLVNNAGVFMPPMGKTADGLDLQLGVNSVGTIYLTQQLLPLLKAGKPSRVVIVSSNVVSMAADVPWEDLGGEKLTESSFTTYATSKLCNALYAMELNERNKDAGVEAFCVHPGRFVATELTSKANQEHWFVRSVLPPLFTAFSITPADGAVPALYAATAPELAGKGGSMYGPNEINACPTGEWKPGNKALTPENAKRLLDDTLKLIAAKGGKPDAK